MKDKKLRSLKINYLPKKSRFKILFKKKGIESKKKYEILIKVITF